MHLNLENSRKSYDQHHLEEASRAIHSIFLLCKDVEHVPSIEANAMGSAAFLPKEASLRKVLLKEEGRSLRVLHEL